MGPTSSSIFIGFFLLGVYENLHSGTFLSTQQFFTNHAHHASFANKEVIERSKDSITMLANCA